MTHVGIIGWGGFVDELTKLSNVATKVLAQSAGSAGRMVHHFPGANALFGESRVGLPGAAKEVVQGRAGSLHEELLPHIREVEHASWARSGGEFGRPHADIARRVSEELSQAASKGAPRPQVAGGRSGYLKPLAIGAGGVGLGAAGVALEGRKQ